MIVDQWLPDKLPINNIIEPMVEAQIIIDLALHKVWMILDHATSTLLVLMLQ